MEGGVVYEAAAEGREGACGGVDFADRRGAFGGSEVAAYPQQRHGVFEEHGQGGDGAGNDEVEGFAAGGFAAEVFGAAFNHLDARQAEPVDDVFEEPAFLAHGFQQDEGDVGPDYAERQPR